MRSHHVLGVDFGTESCRAGVFDAQTGEALGFCSEPYPTHFPRPSYAEQDPRDWWRAMGVAVKGALAAANAANAAADANPPSSSSSSPPTKTIKIAALCVDTTCCTVVAFDRAHPQREPLRPAILWMDMRAAAQAERVLATRDPAVIVNGASRGPVSAEWFLPKALWIKENEPEVWNKPHCGIAEFQDWINLRLTGEYVASRNNVGVRWHWQAADEDGFAAGGLVDDDEDGDDDDGDDPTRARAPLSLMRALGIEADLRARWPGERVLPLAAKIGRGLTAEAAAHLGLEAGTLVAQGGADAFIGMIGLGVTEAGEMAMLTGSSHLHLGLSDKPIHSPGVFGTYAGALLPGLHVVEGGQTSTGSAVAWLRGKVLNAGGGGGGGGGGCGGGAGVDAGAADAAAGTDGGDDDGGDDDEEDKEQKKRRRPPPPAAAAAAAAAPPPSSSAPLISYAELDAQAARLPPGSDGLLALDHFQGNRTPHTDARSRGALVGLTLAHTPAHLHRALLEGVCFGTEAVLGAMRRGGFQAARLVVAGGATRSPLWLQMHADVSRLPLSVPRGAGDAPALGCAILAAAAAGFHGGDVRRAARAMVRVERSVEPDAGAARRYARVYRRWQWLYPALRATFHDDDHGDGDDGKDGGEAEEEEEGGSRKQQAQVPPPPPLVPAPAASAAPAPAVAGADSGDDDRPRPPTRAMTIAPSLLAADLSDLPAELARLRSGDADGGDGDDPLWLHYDCFDGSLRTQITFGAPLLERLAARAAPRRVDVHLIAREPHMHLPALQAAGAHALTLQYENVCFGGGGDFELQEQEKELASLLRLARGLGFATVGLALALGTPAAAARPFLPLVDRVLVMAVPLGFGGQCFQRDKTLAKVRELRAMGGPGLSVGVDGGVGEREAELCAEAGADFLVAGSSVFRADDPAEAERKLLRAAVSGRSAAAAAAAAETTTGQ